MTQEVDNHSRRKFIKRSAGMIGAMGVVAASSSKQGEAACLSDPKNIDPKKPELEYPWRVGVDIRAKLSLVLLRDSITSIHDMVYRRSFREVLEGMLYQFQLMTSSNDPSPEYDCILTCLDTHTTAELIEKLTSAITILWRNDVEYIELASTAKSGWPTGLFAALEDLDEIISVPIVHVVDATIRTFRTSPKGQNFEKYSAHRSIQALFCNKKTYIDQRPGELNAFHEARDVGLLWCVPRGVHILEDYVPRAETTNNDKYCVDNGDGTQRCDPMEDEYCQIVDGVCNGMST